MNALIFGNADKMDIMDAEAVQIQVSADGKQVWVNVDGICRFRACRSKVVEIKDMRPINKLRTGRHPSGDYRFPGSIAPPDQPR